jgi:hypothetical protein
MFEMLVDTGFGPDRQTSSFGNPCGSPSPGTVVFTKELEAVNFSEYEKEV